VGAVVGECFESVSGLAFLHRLVLAFHVVCVEMGVCEMRLGCLLAQLTGFNRCVGASSGTQQQGTSIGKHSLEGSYQEALRPLHYF
jgi:hypothetical protein